MSDTDEGVEDLFSDKDLEDALNYAIAKVCKEAGYIPKEFKTPDGNGGMTTTVKCTYTQEQCLDQHFYEPVTPNTKPENIITKNYSGKKGDEIKVTNIERNGEFPIYSHELPYGEWGMDKCIAADYAFKTIVARKRLDYVQDPKTGVGHGLINKKYCDNRCLSYSPYGSTDMFIFDVPTNESACAARMKTYPNPKMPNQIKYKCIPACYQNTGTRIGTTLLGDTLVRGTCKASRGGECNQCKYDEWCKLNTSCAEKDPPGNYCDAGHDVQCQNLKSCRSLEGFCENNQPTKIGLAQNPPITSTDCMNCCNAAELPSPKCLDITDRRDKLKCEDEECAKAGKCIGTQCGYWDRTDKKWLLPENSQCAMARNTCGYYYDDTYYVYENGTPIKKKREIPMLDKEITVSTANDTNYGANEYAAPGGVKDTVTTVKVPDPKYRKKLSCRGFPMRCRAKGNKGDQCSSSNECHDGLWCNTHFKCDYKKKPGEYCAFDNSNACQSNDCAGGAFRCRECKIYEDFSNPYYLEGETKKDLPKHEREFKRVPIHVTLHPDGKNYKVEPCVCTDPEDPNTCKVPSYIYPTIPTPGSKELDTPELKGKTIYGQCTRKCHIPDDTYCVSGQDQCGPNSYCGASNGRIKCQPKKENGKLCLSHAECFNQSCPFLTSGGFKCSPKLNRGSNCGFGLVGACPDGQYCDGINCVDKKSQDRHYASGKVQCTRDDECEYQCTWGKCTNKDGKLSEGNVCAYDSQCPLVSCVEGVGGSCTVNGVTDVNRKIQTTCRYKFPARKCLRPGTLHSSCDDSSDCGDGFVCSWLLCKYPRKKGQSCTDSFECEKGKNLYCGGGFCMDKNATVNEKVKAWFGDADSGVIGVLNPGNW